jgi:hypothetical protein
MIEEGNEKRFARELLVEFVKQAESGALRSEICHLVSAAWNDMRLRTQRPFNEVSQGHGLRYRTRPTKLNEAHELCQKAKDACREGRMRDAVVHARMAIKEIDLNTD